MLIIYQLHRCKDIDLAELIEPCRHFFVSPPSLLWRSMLLFLGWCFWHVLHKVHEVLSKEEKEQVLRKSFQDCGFVLCDRVLCSSVGHLLHCFFISRGCCVHLLGNFDNYGCQFFVQFIWTLRRVAEHLLNLFFHLLFVFKSHNFCLCTFSEFLILLLTFQQFPILFTLLAL